jgi:tungstate transport system substrate-binding protein
MSRLLIEIKRTHWYINKSIRKRKTIMKKLITLSILFLLLLSYCSTEQDNELVLSTTTSVEDSGLLGLLLPIFEKENACRVKAIAVGSGQAIRLAKDGNADAILVHDRKSEEEFVKEGYGEKRIEIMYNLKENGIFNQAPAWRRV